MGTVVGVCLIILVVAFIIWQSIGLYNDFKKKRAKKNKDVKTEEPPKK